MTTPEFIRTVALLKRTHTDPYLLAEALTNARREYVRSNGRYRDYVTARQWAQARAR